MTRNKEECPPFPRPTSSACVAASSGFPAALFVNLAVSFQQTIATGTTVLLNNDENIEVVMGASGYSNTIYGNSKENTLTGGSAADTIYGGDAYDSIHGGGGDDSLYGNDYSDDIYGDDGNDTIFGGAGSDLMYGGDGNDMIYGEDDDDYFAAYSDGVADVYDGGDGYDVIFTIEYDVDLDVLRDIENPPPDP